MRLEWGGTGQRFYETGIDQGVLFIEEAPGVPWVGLVGVNQSQSGGEAKPRFLDGIKIGNGSSPEEFEATIEAYTYPDEFEQCDGTKQVANGLRVTQQRRKSFSMVYRSKIGNDIDGIDRGYKIHILYNVLAEPSDRSYQTISDQTDPIKFGWQVSTRPDFVNGIVPSAHFIIDSRDTPLALLQIFEDLIYGTDLTDSTLPSPGELIFLFDSFEDTVYDAGSPYTPAFVTYDALFPGSSYTSTIDGGAM